MRAAGAVLLALLAAPAAHGEWVDWLLDAELGARFDANVGRASVGSEREDELSFQAGVRGGRVYQLAERTRLSLTAGIDAAIHARFEELNALDADVELALHHKFGVGDVPWIRAFLAGGHREVRADERSGAHLEAGAALGRRLSERLDVRLHYLYARRWGADGPGVVPGASRDVFDQRFHEVTLTGNLLVTPRLLLSAGYTWRNGDFDSNAGDSRFRLLGEVDLQAVAGDTVFGGWVYRVDGNRHSPFVRLNYALADRWSIDLGYAYQYGEGGGLRYRNHVASAALLFRY